MSLPALLYRPRWRSLALLALLLAPLLWPLQQLAERYYLGELLQQNRQTLDLYVANLLGTLRRYEVLPQILGDLPALDDVLRQPQQPEAVERAKRAKEGKSGKAESAPAAAPDKPKKDKKAKKGKK